MVILGFPLSNTPHCRIPLILTDLLNKQATTVTKSNSGVPVWEEIMKDDIWIYIYTLSTCVLLTFEVYVYKGTRRTFFF